MTEAQRIGQLFMVGIGAGPEPLSTELRQIATSHLGSVWYAMRTTAGVASVRQLSDQVQAVAGASSTDGVGFLIGANQEGGLIQALGGPGFDTIPSGLTQGTLPASTLEGLAAVWGRQLRAAGVDVDFAPVADVVPPGTDATNAPIGQLDRELGHDPTTSATHVAAFIAGMRAADVLTTAKHFPGLGRVQGNTDDTAGVVDPLTSATDPALEPFRAAVRAGVPFVMVSAATYPRIDPDHLAVFSLIVIDGLLRRDLGFDGVVLSDSLTAAAVSTVPPGTRAIDFLAAGGDLIVLNGTATAVQMTSAVAARVAVDATFRTRVDTAARRVLEMKATAGLLPCS